MTMEERSDTEGFVSRPIRDDAVVVVRRALERGEKGLPSFPSEQAESNAAVRALHERLQKLKARGPEFADIELSVYAKHLPGMGRMTLAS